MPCGSRNVPHVPALGRSYVKLRDHLAALTLLYARPRFHVITYESRNRLSTLTPFRFQRSRFRVLTFHEPDAITLRLSRCFVRVLPLTASRTFAL